MIPGAIAGLSLVALGLGGTIAVELIDRPALVLFAGRTAMPQVEPHETAPLSNNDIDPELNAILARPVFSPDRKPIRAGTRGIAGLSRLTGIVVTGSSRIAIFAAPSGGRPIVAEEGSHMDAYELKAISDTGVTVVGPNGTTTLTPLFDPALPPLASKPVISAPPKQVGTGAKRD